MKKQKVKLISFAIFTFAIVGYVALRLYPDDKNPAESVVRETAHFMQTKLLAEKGDASFQYQLAQMYSEGKEVAKSDEQAFSWYLKSAKQSNADAQNRLGHLYYNGTGVKSDFKQSLFWYIKAAEQGNVDAQESAAGIYYSRNGVEQSGERAVFWYIKADENGSASAAAELGGIYQRGYPEDIKMNMGKSITWYTKAAEKGHVDSQLSLGNIFAKGEGVEKNPKQAEYWYTKAAELDNDAAQLILGEMYHNAEGVEKNETKAVYWYTKAADKGNMKAQLKLGKMYLNGDGVDKDEKQAAHWLAKVTSTADEGEQFFQLGHMYATGRSDIEDVEKNEADAFYWYTLAAKKGNAAGEYELGLMYEDSSVVAHDQQKAMYWYTQAAEHGYSEAKFSVKSLKQVNDWKSFEAWVQDNVGCGDFVLVVQDRAVIRRFHSMGVGMSILEPDGPYDDEWSLPNPIVVLGFEADLISFGGDSGGYFEARVKATKDQVEKAVSAYLLTHPNIKMFVQGDDHEPSTNGMFIDYETKDRTYVGCRFTDG